MADPLDLFVYLYETEGANNVEHIDARVFQTGVTVEVRPKHPSLSNMLPEDISVGDVGLVLGAALQLSVIVQMESGELH